MPEILSVKGIEKLLKSQNPHKAAGPDQLKPIVLHTLAPILQVIFQKSLDSGKLPHIWKEANVSPILKKGGKLDPANNRPISLTCGGGRVVRWCWVNFQCRGVLLIWIKVGQGPTALAVGAGGVIWTFFLSSIISIISLFFLSLFGRRPDID